MRWFRLAVSTALAFGVAGCVLPPAFTIASFVADGISLAGGGKTVTDHAISLLAHRDCRPWRLIQGKSICCADTSVVAVAKLPPPLPLRAASPGLDAPASVVAIATPVEAPAAAEPAPAPAAEAPSPTAAQHVAGDSRVRGEMINRSGTDEAEARALADSLSAVGAAVRPVRHGDITIYEVVMGLSG